MYVVVYVYIYIYIYICIYTHVCVCCTCVSRVPRAYTCAFVLSDPTRRLLEDARFRKVSACKRASAEQRNRMRAQAATGCLKRALSRRPRPGDQRNTQHLPGAMSLTCACKSSKISGPGSGSPSWFMYGCYYNFNNLRFKQHKTSMMCQLHM